MTLEDGDLHLGNKGTIVYLHMTAEVEGVAQGTSVSLTCCKRPDLAPCSAVRSAYEG
jgi:hypothetical protein